jgi:hypothetical protein
MKTNLVSSKTAISTVLIALVAIVVVAAVAGGIYFATTQNKPSSRSASESPTPTSAVTQSPTPITTASTAPTNTVNPSATPSPSVAGASSLQYSVSLSADTPSSLRGTYTIYGKNIGTTYFMMRFESTDSGLPPIVIISGAEQKAWSYSSGKWTDISADYNSWYGTYDNIWNGYVAYLAAWNGVGDYKYTLGNAAVRIYDISVNPVLSDSLFQHS